ncbi:hypothetical protein F7725_013947 [Dissostichus mawsoni]|uniref:MMS19 nucleotide excision repair protein n=1 Tax=Dissostichus mawsoni TaxID=36200 RepID=A0A7J5YX05_DISMA|nr:hypothetical protein F7725_013947 [Dissostichus mawsoni]
MRSLNSVTGTMAADSALLLSLVEEYVSGLQDSKAKDTATAVKNGEFTVLQLVEALGLSLTSSQPHTRARGVQLLSEVLHECYGGLTEKEVEVLLVFYENRLKDHHVITPPVLQGLRALSLMLTERACVYNMLINLMAIREAELKGLGPDFVFGFVQSMDGERDPRNLLLAFQIAKGIPPNDPHGITREELILTLRDVLTGTPGFAETACVSQYEHKDLAEFLEGLWASLRREVFQTSSEKIESAGLAAITAITSCLSRSVLNSDSEDSLNTFLELVLKAPPSGRAASSQPPSCPPSSSSTPTELSMVFSALTETNSSLQLAVDHLTRLLLTEQDHTVSVAVVDCAGALADLHPVAFISNFIPRLKTEMFSVRQRCLSALAAVSIKPSVVQESTPVLLQVLSAAHTAEQVPDSEETGRCFHDVIIPRLLSLALQAALQVLSWRRRSSPPWLALQTASRAVSLFLDGDVSFLPDNSFPSNIQLLKVEVPRVDELLSALEEMSCSVLHPLSYTSAAKCLSGLLNKKPQGDSLDSRIHSTMKRVCSELDSSSSSVHTQAFTLMIWLFSLLDDAALGPLAADGFSLLMSDSPDILNRGCHADVRIMYRQRFFSENSAKLVQGFNAAPQEKKPNFLKALSNIVNKLPKQVQLTELPALLSLLLEALSCPDLGSSSPRSRPRRPAPPLIQQLEALIGRLLALTGSPDMEVRISSLRCIHAVSQFPEHEILPVRARVLRALARPLDDRKRLVRREAVHARNDW